MATCKFLIPIEIHGKFGNMVFKNRHGKDYISPLPRPLGRLTDNNSVFNQEQFRFISEFTTAVNKVKFIKEIWVQTYPECYGSYQEIYKANFHDFLYTDLTGIPKLSPEKGFELKNPEVEIIDDFLSLKSDPLDPLSGISEKYITSAALLILRSQESLDSGKNKILCLQGKNVLFNPLSQIDLEINIGHFINQIDSIYNLSQIYIFTATLDETEKPIRYSEMISHFIPLPTPVVVDSGDPIGISTM
jgi:hypothetical protein